MTGISISRISDETQGEVTRLMGYDAWTQTMSKISTVWSIFQCRIFKIRGFHFLMTLSFVMRNGSFMLIVINQLNDFITLSGTNIFRNQNCTNLRWLFGRPSLAVCITAFWNLTTTTEVYCQQPDKMYKMLPALVNWRSPLQLYNISCQYDVRITLQKILEILTHPPYSPDLSPADYHFIPSSEIVSVAEDSFENCFASNNIRPFQ